MPDLYGITVDDLPDEVRATALAIVVEHVDLTIGARGITVHVSPDDVAAWTALGGVTRRPITSCDRYV